jgi:hypothetical protein
MREEDKLATDHIRSILQRDCLRLAGGINRKYLPCREGHERNTFWINMPIIRVPVKDKKQFIMEYVLHVGIMKLKLVRLGANEIIDMEVRHYMGDDFLTHWIRFSV